MTAMPTTETNREQPYDPLEIAILLDDAVTVTDATNPYEVLHGIPNATVKFVAAVPGPKRADSGFLTLVADYALDDVPHPDVIVVPAADYRPAIQDGKLLSWLRTAHDTARWTTAVCGGAMLLALAGLLRGRRATTHWLAMDDLPRFGATPCPDERWVRDGTIVTTAGTSGGIDMAFWLAAQLAGETVAQGIQLMMEYDLQPPFDSGSRAKASPEVEAWARWRAGQMALEMGIPLDALFGEPALTADR